MILTVLTRPSSPLKTSAPRSPARVWMVIVSPGTILWSAAYLATHLMPLPHISASLPSALMMRMVMSVPSPGMT